METPPKPKFIERARLLLKPRVIAGLLAAAIIVAIAIGNIVFIVRDSYDFRQVDGAFYSDRALWIADAMRDDGFQFSDLKAGHGHISGASFNWIMG